MGILSFGVLFYQVLIATIILCAAAKGKKLLLVALVLASLWTLSHVFYPPLMVLQFCTIIFAGMYGFCKQLPAMKGSHG
jgi:hypothetical protein